MCISEFANKKTADNEVHLYIFIIHRSCLCVFEKQWLDKASMNPSAHVLDIVLSKWTAMF